MTQTATIAYGPTFAREVAEFLGQPLHTARVIDSGIYGSPTFTTRELADGRVVEAIHGAMYDRLKVYENWKEYWSVRHATDRVTIDPETGRLR